MSMSIEMYFQKLCDSPLSEFYKLLQLVLQHSELNQDKTDDENSEAGGSGYKSHTIRKGSTVIESSSNNDRN